jgi:hypothetical protein
VQRQGLLLLLALADARATLSVQNLRSRDGARGAAS